MVNNKSVSGSDFVVFEPFGKLKVNVDRNKAESEKSNVACLETDGETLQGKTIYILMEMCLIYDLS